MFNSKDITSVDRRYFHVISQSASHIVLLSPKTEHHWTIHHEVIRGISSSYKLWHKYHEYDPWHFQGKFKSISSIQNYIKRHDINHLKRLRTRAVGIRKSYEKQLSASHSFHTQE